LVQLTRWAFAAPGRALSAIFTVSGLTRIDAPRAWSSCAPQKRGDVKGQTAASDRFNYDYSDDELASFVSPMRGLAEKAFKVHGVFNNNFEDQGQRNAKTLHDLFTE
jgi:uncharacterized protein YecE (DUF72 family)